MIAALIQTSLNPPMPKWGVINGKQIIIENEPPKPLKETFEKISKLKIIKET